MSTTDLQGKVAVVTGASRGIGAAVARALDKEGVRLGLASRRGADLGIEDTVASPCDVRDPVQVEALVAATVKRFGRLDIVVANAGVGAYAPFLELRPEDVEEMIDVNVKGLLYTVGAALPHLLANWGRRHRHARFRGWSAWLPSRDCLLRVQVCSSWVHTRSGS
jgi:NAD(P)-dependent dehydrogenase (short-subunit alcohol dehydrogenase family)